MKAITVKYPWSVLICSGIKDVENRTWNTGYRCRVFIHEGKKIDSLLTFTKNQLDCMKETSFTKEIIMNKKYGSSAIIGSVDIVGCVKGNENNGIWAEYSDDRLIYNWILFNPILYEKPLPCKGALSFWDTGLREMVINKESIRLVDIESGDVVHTTKIKKL